MNFNYNTRAARWEMHLSINDPRNPWRQQWDWCWQTFGYPGTDPDTGVKSGWDYHGGDLYFYEEKCVTMFLLKWQR